ncbi:OmpR-family two-component system manganese-sensing response regulator [Oikeobacillus pervagus]|uniref:OmpR-family two-component system manganese-sensing response regulator n=1 Tax=Oikeobacillus pervagus TaxID=1325931 RepID=A0AAJ1SZK8_9BACI|nr:response regulator transcription factor [Oikeobacillus pervagus]MDQ0215755.1 OmpR-family two-component system manganese-sensing response regulator [Oikeobacillus pervagus]
MKILLAEDDIKLGKIIRHMIQKENHQVELVDNGRDALDFALIAPYDVIILDWMMPKLNGMQVCEHLRQHGYQGGIIFLTAKDEINDIITGLDHGADDYIVKPFKMEELLARVRALSRRKEKTFEQEIKVGNLTLYLDSLTLYRHHEKIVLTKKEYQFIEYLFRNKGRILTREQILERIWGLDSDVTDNALDALVKLVRKKIDQNQTPSLIQNVRGIGYKLRDDDV